MKIFFFKLNIPKSKIKKYKEPKVIYIRRPINAKNNHTTKTKRHRMDGATH